MKTVLIVGLSRKAIRDYLLDHGYEYVLLQDTRKILNPEIAPERVVICDFSSWDTIKQALNDVLLRSSIEGVFTSYENYVLPASQIAQNLNLPGLSIEAANACTDKQIMRELFSRAPQKISPEFIEVKSEDDVRMFAESHTFPLILKPANLAKSLMVTKNDNLDQLLSNYRKATETIAAIYAKYAPTRAPKILLEEFMEGTIHSVDAFVDAEGIPHVLQQVVDYQTGYDIGYDDNFHYSRIVPSKLPELHIAQIRETASIGCRALGITNSPAHIEVILTAEGPMIVEIGARNGGYRERMHDVAHGIDITENQLALAFGAKLSLQADKNEPCAVLELFPKTPGYYKELQNETTLSGLRSLVYLAIKQQPGTYVGKSSDGYKMSAIIILHNSDPAVFAADLQYVREQVMVVTTDSQ